ncbi:MAG: hypothetical protein M3384_12850 [Acidobacteriota bacterium]|nr:hypothetical protein [Acidobacteriota bacterium]
MLPESFLISLEYSIAIALENAGEKYWCDGVYPLDSDGEDDLAPGKVRDSGEIRLRAAMPKGQYEDEQFWFDLILKFGKRSLERYAKGESLDDCIPDLSGAGWIKLDVENKIVEARLK